MQRKSSLSIGTPLLLSEEGSLGSARGVPPPYPDSAGRMQGEGECTEPSTAFF